MSSPMNIPVIAAGTALPFPAELVLLLALSVGIAYLCYRIGLVPIAGFLLAGVVIGPGALGLVEDRELQKFLVARALMIATALTGPLYVSLAQERTGQSLDGLGWLLVASGFALRVPNEEN